MKNEIDDSNSNGASRRGGTDFLKVELEELEALLEDANAQEPEELEAAYNRVSEIYDQLEAKEQQQDFGNYTNCRGMTSAFVSNEQVAFGEDRQLLNFRFPSAEPLKGGGGHLISMEDCRFRYPTAEPDSTWLLQDMSLNVSNGSRIAIVGKNDAGKSTLLKLMSGELQVSKGEFHRHCNLKIAHITQHHI